MFTKILIKRIISSSIFSIAFAAMMMSSCSGMRVSADIVRKIGVFCSARENLSDALRLSAYTLGKNLAQNGYGIVLGGSGFGLMKEVVDGYLSCGSGEYVYTFPLNRAKIESLQPVNPGDISSINAQFVDSIHIRLGRFQELCEAVIVLPGGLGTLHELVDFLAHKQLKIIKTHIFLMNESGFWNDFLKFLDSMVAMGLLSLEDRYLLTVVDSCQDCLHAIKAKHE